MGNRSQRGRAGDGLTAALGAGMAPPLRGRTVKTVTQELARRWGLPDLPGRVEIAFSARLTRRIGRALPQGGQIRLGIGLRGAPPKLLREVLCHELAHVAVYLRHGSRPKPHGREWRRLMEEAGQVPRVSLSMAPGARLPAARPVFVHICTVCQAARRAHRPMRAWRCAACVSQGLDGMLEIERVSR